jgi:filamentous hemagglutinin
LIPDAPDVPMQNLDRAVIQESAPDVPDLDPASSPIYTNAEARRLPGPNTGVIFVQERIPAARRGQDFEGGTSGAFSDGANQTRVVPALRFQNPNSSGVNFVRFDGYEDGGRTLIDRKTQLTTGSKQLRDLRRVDAAMRQNPDHRLVYEFPTRQAADAAQRILDAQGIENVTVRVAVP